MIKCKKNVSEKMSKIVFLIKMVSYWKKQTSKKKPLHIFSIAVCIMTGTNKPTPFLSYTVITQKKKG